VDPQDVRRLLRARNLDEIPDAETREWVGGLVTMVEALVEEVALLKRELAAARRDQGSGRPPGSARGGRGTARQARSSRSNRANEPRQRVQRQPRAALVIHAERFIAVDPALLTGPGWQRWGYEDRVIQDVRLTAHHTRFRLEKWYSASQRRTVVAPLPPGYREGGYGPHVKALVLQLGHHCRVTVDPLTTFLQQCGLQLSAATVSAWLSGKELLAPFHAEAEAVFRSGMATAFWIGHDVTPTKLNGTAWACHGLSNERFSSFFTLPGQDGERTLLAFQGLLPLCYRWDAGAAAALRQATGPITQAVRQQFARLKYGRTWTAAGFARFLAKTLPRIHPATAVKLRHLLAVAGYRHRQDCATPYLTIKDDAPSSHGLTPKVQLCWWHEDRHYEQLKLTGAAGAELEKFRRGYWLLYRLIRRLRPSAVDAKGRADPAETERYQQRADQLRRRFHYLLTWKFRSPQLLKRMRLTLRKADDLLTVLDHPGIPMHNNGSERTLRPRARKRDQSYQARSLSGLAAWDTMQSLMETSRKLGINFQQYLIDRLTDRQQISPLSALVAARTPAG
jgi:hypothetical protein